MWLKLLTLLLISSTSLAAPSARCNDLLVERMIKVVADGRYENFRGLADYRGELGAWFSDFLGKLGRRARWIDMGAGHARAQREYALERIPLAQRLILGKAQLLAVAYEQPVFHDRSALYDSKLPWPKNLKRLLGRFVEDIPDDELGNADLITDVYGAISYSARLDEVLNKYLRVLSDDGAIFFHAPSWKTRVRLKDGRTLSLSDWLTTIDGLDVETRGSTVRLGKKRSNVQVPRLELMDGTSEKPPERLFQEL